MAWGEHSRRLVLGPSGKYLKVESQGVLLVASLRCQPVLDSDPGPLLDLQGRGEGGDVVLKVKDIPGFLTPS